MMPLMPPMHPCRDRVTGADCPKRSADCGLTCKDWKEYEIKRNEYYEQKRTMSKGAENYTAALIARIKKKTSRRKK